MSRIPQTVLAAGAAMFSPYAPDLTPGQLEQFLQSKPERAAKLEPGLTPKEFTAIMKVSRQTLHNMEKRGEIRLIRFGHTVRIPATEVKRLLSLDGGE